MFEHRKYYCTSLKSIEIPDSVQTIGGWAFSNCSKITYLEIGKNVTTIGEDSFSYCSNLETVKIVSDKLTSITDYAFYYCFKLSSINIPEKTTYIGRSAFNYCKNLSSITIPQTVNYIGINAFVNCNNLTDVYYKGRCVDFKKINIEYGNNSLIDAKLHGLDISLNITKTNNIFLVSPINIYKNEYIIFVCYNGNKMVYVNPYIYTGESTIPFTTTEKYDKVKVMVWENSETCVPLCEAEIVPLN